MPDAVMTEPVHDMLEAAGLAPGEHAVDAGYTSGDLLLAARARGITLLGPLLAGTPPKARAGGYTADAFTIDWDHQQVTCPQGAASSRVEPVRPARKKQTIVVRFAAATCRACPARDQCTPSAPAASCTCAPAKSTRPSPPPAPAQASQQWKHRYNIRAGVEGTIRQATHVTGIRRARYLGLDKTRLEHNAAAAALNLIRLDAWWTGKPLDRTRTTHLQRLNLTTTAEP